jgi:hypothetical protein
MLRALGHSNRPALETLEDRLVPSTMAGNYADGIWRWDSSAGWAHISTQQASTLVVDDAGDVFGQFSTGVWRWDAGTKGWQLLSYQSQNSDLAVTGSGVLYANFASMGVWRWSLAGWQKLSDFNDTGGLTVSNSDALFATFTKGVAGTWRWTPTQGWSLLSNFAGHNHATDNAGDFFAIFDGFEIDAGHVGTWRWTPSGGWQRLTSIGPENINVSNNGAIYENRAAGGIWYLAPGQTTFTQITNLAAGSSLLHPLPNGGLFDVYRVGSQSSGWYFNASTGNWSLLISDLSNFSDSVVGKDSDVFIALTGAGLWQWGPTIPYHQLGAQNPMGLTSQSGPNFG